MSKSKVLISVLIIAVLLILLITVGWLVKSFFGGSSSEKSEITVNNNLDQNKTSNQTNNANLKKRDAIWNETVGKDEELQKKSDSLLHLLENMPSVPVYTKDEPIQKSGKNTERGVAYTICEAGKPTIFVKKIYYQKANQKQLINTLKHELVHAYFCRQGFQVGHDKAWREKFESIGGFGN